MRFDEMENTIEKYLSFLKDKYSRVQEELETVKLVRSNLCLFNCVFATRSLAHISITVLCCCCCFFFLI